MKVFVWERIQKVSNAWHPEGGLVVFADTENRARELANQEEGCKLRPEEKPDEIREVLGGEEKVFTMLDAGCC